MSSLRWSLSRVSVCSERESSRAPVPFRGRSRVQKRLPVHTMLHSCILALLLERQPSLSYIRLILLDL